MQQAQAEARQLGMFTGPTWTVLLTTGGEPGATLLPFVVRARHPMLAQVAAAAVIGIEELHVIGVIPGNHVPLAGSHLQPAARLAAEHPQAHTAAAAVLDAHLAELLPARDQTQTSRRPRAATSATHPAGPDHAIASRGH